MLPFFEDYLEDEDEIDPKAGGGDPMTIGQMVNHSSQDGENVDVLGIPDYEHFFSKNLFGQIFLGLGLVIIIAPPFDPVECRF